MSEVVQIKAEIPRDLKRRAFAAFALRDEKFTRWLRLQLEAWLREVDENNEENQRPFPQPVAV
jgi:hypothetical protein